MKLKIGMGLLAVVLVGLGWYWTQSASMITVMGEGEVQASPESVSMIVTRVDTAENAGTAIDAGETAIEKLVQTARNFSGSGVEIKETFYQLSNSQAGKFVVANAFMLKSKNVSGTNTLIKQLYWNGATSVTNINFSPAESDEVLKEVKELGMKSAQEKAEKLAMAAGKRITRMVSVNDDSSALTSAVSDKANAGSKDLEKLFIQRAYQVTFEMR